MLLLLLLLALVVACANTALLVVQLCLCHSVSLPFPVLTPLSLLLQLATRFPSHPQANAFLFAFVCVRLHLLASRIIVLYGAVGLPKRQLHLKARTSNARTQRNENEHDQTPGKTPTWERENDRNNRCRIQMKWSMIFHQFIGAT